jgi:protein TonB
MSYLINNQQKINDIIFAGRNKNYGAYALRSAYGSTLLKSLLFMISCVGACMLTAYYLCNHNSANDLGGQIILPNDIIYSNTVVDLTPKDKPDSKSAAPAKASPGVKQPEAKGGAVAIVDSADIKTPAPVIENMLPDPVVTTGPATATTTDNGNGNPDAPDNGTSNKKGNSDVLQLFGVDTQPEFEGGLAALNRFLSNNLRYPSAASEIGKEGIIHVEFVVDENGKVGSLRLQNKAGYGFEEEALRVVGLIPNFKTPAKLSGKPVKVYYQIPIRFKMR